MNWHSIRLNDDELTAVKVAVANEMRRAERIQPSDPTARKAQNDHLAVLRGALHSLDWPTPGATAADVKGVAAELGIDLNPGEC